MASPAAWLVQPTRFAGISRIAARLILALLVLLAAYGAAVRPAPVPRAVGNVAKDRADVLLYEAIVERLRDGGDYYEVATEELRTRNYPLRPFVTVRMPTLAVMLAKLPDGEGTIRLLLGALIVAVLAVWAVRLRDVVTGRLPLGIGVLLVASGMAVFIRPEFLLWHEVWAGLLMALALGLRTPRHWGLAVIAGLAALLIRELALPFIAAMALLAATERRWREAVAWGAVIAVFAAALALHASAVATHVTASDPLSPGWTKAGGWRFVVTILHLTGPLRLAPQISSAVLVPLALLGWAAWRSSTGGRGALALFAYAGTFLLVGRPQNFYWGLLIAPLVPLGLLFAPAALRDLWRAAALRLV